MNQAPLYQSDRVQTNQNCKAKCEDVLVQLDFFSYVPQPHTYPVSTTKSKIASIVFLVAVTSYLTYDFVKFITSNSPLINTFDQSIPLDVQYQAPQIAFGFVYGPSLNITLNDPSYFTYTFFSIQSSTDPNTTITTQDKTILPITQNCNPEWLGVYNNVYPNMSCINQTTKLMNVPSQSLNSLSLRLYISACKPGGNVTCSSQNQLYKMTSGGRFFLIINLPAGFDYNTGSVAQSDYSVQIYQFFLVPKLFGIIDIQYYPFQFTTFPTYFTTWRNQQFFYMQSYEPAVQISDISMFDSQIMMSISFMLYPELTVVEVKYQTFINRMSEWGALASLIMTIFGLCCLTYNKNKFLQKNPGWEHFDEAMKKKEDKVMQIQLQNMGERQNDEEQNSQYEESDIGGLNAIRKKVEINKGL